MPRTRRSAALLVVTAVFFVGACSSSGSTAGTPSSTTRPVAATTTLDTTRPTPAAASYGVGRVDLTFVDHSRKTDGNAKQKVAPKDSRTLPVMVLYPTSTASDNAEPNGHPVAAGRFPLIVFSHGVTASGPAYGGFLKAVAQAGYIVAAPTFPLTSGPGGWANLMQVRNQPADVTFVIGQMLDLSAKSSGAFSSHLASGEIGIAGHSLGAITTLGFFNTCCHDPRIEAAVSLSGVELPYPKGDYSSPPSNLPLLLIHGQADKTVPYQGSKNVFAAFTKDPRAFITYPDAGHTDVVAKAPYMKDSQTAMIAFFDLELRHDGSKWKTVAARLATDKSGSIAVAGGLPSAG